jgi:hypothetical protein
MPYRIDLQRKHTALYLILLALVLDELLQLSLVLRGELGDCAFEADACFHILGCRIRGVEVIWSGERGFFPLTRRRLSLILVMRSEQDGSLTLFSMHHHPRKEIQALRKVASGGRKLPRRFTHLRRQPCCVSFLHSGSHSSTLALLARSPRPLPSFLLSFTLKQHPTISRPHHATSPHRRAQPQAPAPRLRRHRRHAPRVLQQDERRPVRYSRGQETARNALAYHADFAST